MKAKISKVRGFGLVRDKNGKPKVDDIKSCPPEILAMMTKEEIELLIKEQT